MEISKPALLSLIGHWERAVLESYVAQSMLDALARKGQVNQNWRAEFERVVSLPEVASLIHEGFQRLYQSLENADEADRALLDTLSKIRTPEKPN